jgi:hypothetical protein
MRDNIRHLIIINCNNITYNEKIIIEDSVEYLISNIILHKLKYRIFLNFKDLNIRWSNAFHETKSYTSEQVLNFSRYYQNNFKLW